jgi:hypothetical protein
VTYFPEPGYIETRPASARADKDEDFFAANEGPRLCVTCRHHQRRSEVDGVGHFCHRPRAPKIDLVTGEELARPIPLRCEPERSFSLSNGRLHCGPLGHYWQRREGEAE